MTRIVSETLTEAMRSLGNSLLIVGSKTDDKPQTFQPSLGDPVNAPGAPDTAEKIADGK
jgi:hypothetical protein